MKSAAILGLLAGLGLQACGGSGGGSAQIVVAPVTPAPSPGPPTQLVTERVFSMLSFDQPLALVQAPDSDAVWYVVERAGRIWMFENRPDVGSASLFADLSVQIESGPGEAGLLGLAFHPEYATNREVFVSYTRNNLGLESVVARMVSIDSGMMLDPSTETLLLTVPQDFTNHNGGQIQFGPDGFLYVGFGDGGSGNDPNDRAQDTTNLLGTIARLDVSAADGYTIPPDNTFAGNPRCSDGFGAMSCPEIFAYGLRNPWRFSFDRADGTLWAGDVGQDRFEEINRLIAGGNYGWRVREASACNIPSTGCETDGFLDPVASYDRNAGVSVTGGYAYRGTQVDLLVDTYVFGDFGSGRIFGIPIDASTGTQPTELLETQFNISSFGEGTDGELYVIDYATGTLHQLTEAPE